MRVKPGHDGVGAHPHAGIETVTYLLSGRQEHRDSAGHIGIVAAGGAQWMTAGRGIIHAESPLAENEEELTLHGIQLWTSLPRLLKLTEPGYQRIDAASIPSMRTESATVRVVGGDFAGTQGPAKTLMPLFLWHVTVDPRAAFTANVASGHEAAAYVIEGEARTDEGRAAAGSLVVFAGTEGALRIENAGDTKLELMVLGGTPAEGPLVFHGPFVMNSVEQVRAADVAYRTGRMGSIPG
jgi:redox-sensitive bicupin YhaK (pirin superfamily)